MRVCVWEWAPIWYWGIVQVVPTQHSSEVSNSGGCDDFQFIWMVSLFYFFWITTHQFFYYYSYVYFLHKFQPTHPSTMARRKLHLGGGTTCSALLKFIHPKPAVNTHFINATACDRAIDLVALRVDYVTRKGRTYKAVFFLAS